MKELFRLDMQDYDPSWPRKIRPSVRAIILRGGEVAMVHSLLYDYYKFPGGGIEQGESMHDALIREVREEAGLRVISESIREFGSVLRIQRSDTHNTPRIFEQQNYYYLCETQREPETQKLDDYEEFERFTLEYVTPQTAIEANRSHDHSGKDPVLIEREARVLERIIEYLAEKI